MSATANTALAARFLSALAQPTPEVQAALLALLHPDAHYMTLGKNAAGAQAVAEVLQHGPNGELARGLRWQMPLAVGDQVRLTGDADPATRGRGLIVTLGFEGGAIKLVQQQRTPPAPPQATPVVLPESLKRMINNALVERHPMLMAYTDPQGQPVLSFRGSVMAYGDDQLAMWIRSADGAFIQAIRQNPRVALVYRNEDSKATYNLQGRARVSDLPQDREQVFARAPEAERAHDFAMLGVVVLVELDRVEGYAGLGPGGQVDQVRMLRGAPQA
jgi:hypothetical protein